MPPPRSVRDAIRGSPGSPTTSSPPADPADLQARQRRSVVGERLRRRTSDRPRPDPDLFVPGCSAGSPSEPAGPPEGWLWLAPRRRLAAQGAGSGTAASAALSLGAAEIGSLRDRRQQARRSAPDGGARRSRLHRASLALPPAPASRQQPPLPFPLTSPYACRSRRRVAGPCAPRLAVGPLSPAPPARRSAVPLIRSDRRRSMKGASTVRRPRDAVRSSSRTVGGPPTPVARLRARGTADSLVVEDRRRRQEPPGGCSRQPHFRPILVL